MSGLLNSNLNGSNSNLLDSSGRPFATQFSAQSASNPNFHHSGGLQNLHNMHGSFNVQNMPASLASRNSAMGGVPSSGVQQPVGIPSGRFASNNLSMALSQMLPTNPHVHSGVTNRGGMGVSPILGNAGSRITSSMGNIVGSGVNVGRTLSTGGGLNVPGLASRLNLSANSGSGSLGVQAPNRLMSGVLQQGMASPQVISMIGNSYPASGGPLTQSQLQAGNNTLSSLGVLNDPSSNEYSPFDLNDFPQLTGRPSSAGGPQGQLGSMRKQGVGVSSLVQQNQEFSIQNEDFPALPGFKGNNNDFSAMDMHHKEQQLHENAVSMMQNQQFPMSRGAGFSLGAAYPSHRQQPSQQQQHQHAPHASVSGGVSFSSANSQDNLHMHGGSDLFPSSFHRQTSGSSMGMRPLNSSNSLSGIGPYDQLVQQYQQQVHNQSQMRLQPHMSAAATQSYRDQSLKSLQGATAQSTPSDRYGLLGLQNVIRMNNSDLVSLASGIDLTMLGLNLNSSDNLYKTFASPWADGPAKGEPEYVVPECFYATPPPPLHRGYFAKFRNETLFYIFYSMPKDEAQLCSANELYNRGWFYHRELRQWLIRPQNMEPLVKTAMYEQGTYHYFDLNTWDIHLKENFVLLYDQVEKDQQFPSRHRIAPLT